jgi:prolyl-tRNA synthetase
MTALIPANAELQNRLVFAVVRGDMEVNETKLANVLQARSLCPATEEEVRAVGAVPGYASPMQLKGALIVVDDLIPQSPNLVTGANEEGYHLLNVNYGRDYHADQIADIAAAQNGDLCYQCGSPLKTVRGVEVGNIFKLGTRYSESLGCYFLDAQGEPRPVIMGSYGIGIGRLLGCLAETFHDEHGLIWPISVAPYQVHLVVLSGKGDSTSSDAAQDLYKKLQDHGIEVLFDDRSESPGVKFNDADLIGLPIRITVSERAFKSGGFEYKRRDRTEKRIVSEDDVIPFVKSEIVALASSLQQATALTE